MIDWFLDLLVRPAVWIISRHADRNGYMIGDYFAIWDKNYYNR